MLKKLKSEAAEEMKKENSIGEKRNKKMKPRGPEMTRHSDSENDESQDSFSDRPPPPKKGRKQRDSRRHRRHEAR